jgi:hypothetical protein
VLGRCFGAQPPDLFGPGLALGVVCGQHVTQPRQHRCGVAHDADIRPPDPAVLLGIDLDAHDLQRIVHAP